MLPRRRLHRARFGLAAFVLGAALLSAQAPVQAIRAYTPAVDSTQIPVHAITKISTAGTTAMLVYPAQTTPVFTLIGATWSGVIDPSTKFSVRVREHGTWSQWMPLTWTYEHGADGDSSEASSARSGTDPLLTAPSNGAELRATNKSGVLPSDLSLSLVNSQVTSQDHHVVAMHNVVASVPATVMSPQGAVVARPNLITRAQWGANESWRNQDPGMGTKIIAGFIHHTASASNYSEAEGPAQMRLLYSYYTHSLHYKDLAYNFLVDAYGNVYEGRSGCPRVVTAPCDGPSRPAIGAHTAGMNVNTFAISAIGNYQTTNQSDAAFAKIDAAIAGLIAWKIAPYGLDPLAIANIPVGSDPHHLSRYREGDVAHVLTISGHRDVGQTVCPGQYLYAQLPTIRDQIETLLTPVVAVPQVQPNVLSATAEDPIHISTVIAAGAAWSIDVVNNASHEVVAHSSGTQVNSGTVSFDWGHTDSETGLLPAGRYTVRVRQTLSTPAATPSPTPTPTTTRTPSASATPTASPTPKAEVTQRTSSVVIAEAPNLNSAPAWTYRTRHSSTISWHPADSLIPVTYYYRVQDQVTKSYSAWKSISGTQLRVIVRKLVPSRYYIVQIRATNAMGASQTQSVRFKQRKN